VIVFDQVKPATILEGIEHHRITYIHAVPTIFQLILDYPYISRYDTRSVQLAGMMGTTVPISLMKRFKKTFPHVTVVQGYGLTETSPFISLTPAKDADRKMASIGKPVPGVEVKLVGNDGREVRTGQEGEIATRGPHVMKGYHRQPEATREKIRDGWFHTGDIGRFDDEGFLYHLGRKDDLVITGGLNVYPAEVENVLRDHPDIRDVVVFGKPDSKRGMLIAAAVIRREGASPDVREIQSYARRHLAGFKVPQSISFRESFPVTASGKILRSELAGERAQSRNADE
jgi:acyl-CoA synthetase (AMP-forming)/AMP-acid ligase II